MPTDRQFKAGYQRGKREAHDRIRREIEALEIFDGAQQIDVWGEPSGESEWQVLDRAVVLALLDGSDQERDR